MTRNDRDKSNAELEALYREHGDAEPPEGLDRIIRARAERAAESGRRRLAPWIGGVATASVAVVTIAIVLQQSPPTEEPQSPQPAPRAVPAPPADVEGRAASPSAEADSSRRASGFRAVPELVPAPAAETSRLRPDVETDALLAAIREHVEAGEIEAARRLLGTLREREPDFQLPADLADALDAVAAGRDTRREEDDSDDSGS